MCYSVMKGGVEHTFRDPRTNVKHGRDDTLQDRKTETYVK